MDDFAIPTIPEIREMEREAEMKSYCPLCGTESLGVCAICWDEVPQDGGFCRCGTPLPAVRPDETPYEFCSDKCATKGKRNG